MVTHCGKCGSVWREGNRFCVGCGAPDELSMTAVDPKTTVAVRNDEETSMTVDRSDSIETAPYDVTRSQTDANMATDAVLAPVESCPSCAAPWRQGAVFCTKCGFTIAPTNAIDFASERSEYGSTPNNVPWPMVAVIALLIIGVATWFLWNSSNGEQAELAAVEQSEDAAIIEPESTVADANNVDTAATPELQNSSSSTQQLPVSGIYAGDIAGSRVFLSLNANSPQPLVVATGSARYQIGSELVCDTIIAAASGTADGLVRLEQRPSGSGKPCPKNYPIILDTAPGATFSNGSADMLKATWLDPQNNGVLGTSILQR